MRRPGRASDPFLGPVDNILFAIGRLGRCGPYVPYVTAPAGLCNAEAEIRLPCEEAWEPAALLRFGPVVDDGRQPDHIRARQARRDAALEAGALVVENQQVESVEPVKRDHHVVGLDGLLTRGSIRKGHIEQWQARCHPGFARRLGTLARSFPCGGVGNDVCVNVAAGVVAQGAVGGVVVGRC